MVDGIVRNFDGVIYLASHPGKGTTFRILLPCAQPASETTATRSHAPGTRHTGHRRPPCSLWMMRVRFGKLSLRCCASPRKHRRALLVAAGKQEEIADAAKIALRFTRPLAFR